MTSDLDAILATVLDRPADDTARLVYADALEENGQFERADLIRLSLDKHDDCEECQRLQRQQRPDERGKRICIARAMMLVEVSKYREQFAPDVKGVELSWRRGFIAEVRGPLAVLRGEECPACRGLIRVQINGGGSMIAMDDPCPACHGTGRTPGVLAELVRREPVERVEAVDREPLSNHGVEGYFGGDANSPADQWFWIKHHGPGELTEWSVPAEVYDLMPGDGSFDSTRLARTALSNALLLEAKQKAAVLA